ncbi:hypothetical protein FOLKNPGA_03440 [Legionella sp. PC1000]|uniref:hypothetical protein n=1 Tax=Legionella sp. PC1000 TaxID=2746060 RepID=UPI0015FA7774|nr:hypothetical protein [Legionella sp. PC1000]QLZ70626.1 hypothetical protein FOLKNPGA_03440 [Legionella sp. PC1000]
MVPTKWDLFFKYNPFFGPITSETVKNTQQNLPQPERKLNATQIEKVIVLQKFWRNVTSANTKVRVRPKSVHLPDSARVIAHVMTDEEIKEIFLHAAQKKQLNSNQVQTILRQQNSLKYAYELLQNDKITKDQFHRIVELHKKYVTEEHRIEKSLNMKQIKHLRKLIDNGLNNLNPELNEKPFQELEQLLKDPDFPQIVFGLFDSIYSAGLQTQQLLTLLELYQAQKKRVYTDEHGLEVASEQPHITAIYRILNDEGDFTEEAKKYLLPSLTRKEGSSGFMMKPIEDNETYDQFKLLVSQLPASEQIFYSTVFPQEPGLTHNVVGEKALAKIEEFGPLSQVEKKFIEFPLIIPSCGARNAIGILRYGINDYMPVIPQFGIKSMADIEQGLRTYRGRLAYLFYPHTPDPGNVHGSARDTYVGIFAHDQYHSDIISSIPQYARDGLLRCVNIIRDQTEMNWSNEIWIWVDADFRYFKTKQFDPQSANSVAHFCSMLDSVQLPFSNLAPYGQIMREKTGISPVGILVMMDMINNKDQWVEIGINPDLLPDASPTRVPSTIRTGRNIHKPLDYKIYYERMKEVMVNYPQITTKPGTSRMLEMMMLCSQEKMPSQQEMVSFGKFVDELQKYNLINLGKNYFNNIVLQFNGITIQEGKESKQLRYLTLMYKAYLENDKQNWNKIDFIKAYQESEQVLKQLDSLFQYKDKPDEKAKKILENFIKAITQNLSELQVEEALHQLKPLIESYSEADLRLFTSSKPPKTPSDRILDGVLKEIYHYGGKNRSLTQLVDSLVNYHDALKQEMNPKDNDISKGLG